MGWTITINGREWSEFANEITLRPGASLRATLLGPEQWWTLGLTGRTATVSLDGAIMLEGTVAAAQYGIESGPCEITVEPQQHTRAAPTIPGPLDVVRIEEWPSAPEKSIGAFYPRVYGYPGDMGGVATPHAVVPVVLVHVDDPMTATYTKGLLCRRQLTANAEDFDVLLWTSQGDVDAQEWAPVENEGDSTRPVHIVRWNGTPSLEATRPTTDGAQVYAGFTPTRCTNPVAILLDLLALVPGFDLSASAEALDIASAYRIDTIINAPVDPWAYAKSIIDWLPVLTSETPQGLTCLRPDPRVVAVTTIVDADERLGDIERTSEVSVSTSNITNELTVEYRTSRDGQPLSRAVLTADAITFVTRGVSHDGSRNPDLGVRHPLAAQSQAAYGRHPETINIGWTWDNATARLVGECYLRRRALPRPRLSARWLRDYRPRRQDVIKCTFPDVGLLAVRCRVLDVKTTEVETMLDLEVLEPGRRATETVTITFTLEADVTITGDGREDSIHTATPAAWSTEPTSRSYQWFSDGVAISGADENTYAPTYADDGLTVVETATLTGTTLTSTSTVTVVARKVRGIAFDRDGCLHSAVAIAAISGTSHTVSGWFLFDDFTAGSSLFSTSNNGAGDHWLNIFDNGSGRTHRRRLAATSNRDYLETSELATTTWVHLTSVYDAATDELKYYIDGTLKATHSTTGATHTVSDAFVWMARDSTATTGPSAGRAADLRIYSVAKDAAAVAALAAEDGLTPDVAGLVSRVADTGLIGAAPSLADRVALGPAWTLVGPGLLASGPGLFIQ